MNWKLCILCQRAGSNKEAVVLNPRTESYRKLLDMVTEYTGMHHEQFALVHKRLEGCTPDMLLANKATWH